jgi:hypothetical protein
LDQSLAAAAAARSKAVAAAARSKAAAAAARSAAAVQWGRNVPETTGEGCGGIEAGIKSPVVTDRSDVVSGGFAMIVLKDQSRRSAVAVFLWG